MLSLARAIACPFGRAVIVSPCPLVVGAGAVADGGGRADAAQRRIGHRWPVTAGVLPGAGADGSGPRASTSTAATVHSGIARGAWAGDGGTARPGAAGAAGAAQG